MDKLSLKMIFVMVVITSISGLVLSGVWSISVKKIRKNETIKIEQALYEINPNAESFEIVKKNEQEIYKCLDADGNLIAYFFLAQGNGFQAPIKIAASTNPSWTQILGIRILEQSETPGLGAKITEQSFFEKFSALSLAKSSIKCIKEKADKSKSEIRAITAATISSKAVVKIINKKIKELKQAGF
ncbi:FMN-binding protein [bacterium]